MNPIIIGSDEEGIKYLQNNSFSDDSFQLAISDSFTFNGKPDPMGMGMAILLDKVLVLGYMPDGFVQKDEFRLYSYKKMNAR